MGDALEDKGRRGAFVEHRGALARVSMFSNDSQIREADVPAGHPSSRCGRRRVWLIASLG
jgi:hypothetical protein